MSLTSAILRHYGLSEYEAVFQADDGTVFRGPVLARNLPAATGRAFTWAAEAGRQLVTVTPKGAPYAG